MKTIKAYLATVFLGGVLGLCFSIAADQLTGVSFDTIAPEAEIIAVLPVFDDSLTRRVVGTLKIDDSSEGFLLVR